MFAADNTSLKDDSGMTYNRISVGGSRDQIGRIKCDAAAFSIELDATMVEQVCRGVAISGQGYTITGMKFPKKSTIF